MYICNLKSILTSSSIIIFCMFLSACGSLPNDIIMPNGSSAYYDSDTPKIEKQKIGRPYQINGKWYTPKTDNNYDEVGIASWYGPGFHGKSTANGEKFDENKISAAHTTLPLPSYVEVTNLDNGKQLYVRVNDRGPFADDRIIDLSKRAAELLGSKQSGLARVRVRIAEPPLNTTLLSPNGSIRVGRGYRPRAQEQKIATATTRPQQNPVAYHPSQQQNSPQVPQYTHDNNHYYQNNAEDPNIAYQEIDYYNHNATNNHTQNSQALPAQNLIPFYESQDTFNQPAYQPIQDTEIHKNLNTSAYNSSNIGNYSIKVGTFSNANNVNILKQNIKSLGQVEINKISKNGLILSEVSLNGYKNQKELHNTIDVLRKYGINDPVIVNNN